jgi:hypothetical protein
MEIFDKAEAQIKEYFTAFRYIISFTRINFDQRTESTISSFRNKPKKLLLPDIQQKRKHGQSPSGCPI